MVPSGYLNKYLVMTVIHVLVDTCLHAMTYIQCIGHIIAQDLTSVLLNHTYWGSYNRPYYTLIAQLTMYESYEATETDGQFYNYMNCARGLMIARAQANVCSHQSYHFAYFADGT
jgi:hypothetical protein